MASFEYDVVIIGSGFGGSVAWLRAATKGYRVGVMEAGRRWEGRRHSRCSRSCRRSDHGPGRHRGGGRGRSRSVIGDSHGS